MDIIRGLRFNWLPSGWSAVALLAGLCIAELYASSLTIAVRNN